MASTLKHWKESASLILACKRLTMKTANGGLMDKLKRKPPQTTVRDTEERLRILLMKRSSGSSFMPNVFVFPGGMLDENDFSEEWLKVFSVNDDLQNLFIQGKSGSPIFSRSREAKYSAIPSEVALRIAAIRETFEETGILLARSEDETKNKMLYNPASHPMFSVVSDLPAKEVKSWRKKVLEDSSQFLKLCLEEKITPDICSLYEWSNWLTPLLRSSRFDTAFFVSCVHDSPPVDLNVAETEEVLWSTPGSFLSACSHGAVSLAPPQVYELSRLSRFGGADDLLTLAWKRSHHRSRLWMPVIYSCTDGIVFSLPGDDLYPDNPDYTGELGKAVTEVPETFAQLAEKYPHHHRAFIQHGSKNISLHCNLEFLDGHILPLTFNEKSVTQPDFV